MKPMSKIASMVLLAGLMAAPALASPQVVGKYKDWTVFQDGSGRDRVCYAATPATDKAPKAAEHGEVWFYVTNWQSGLSRNQPSLKVGYELREGRPARARIGRSSWTLFTAANEAFADDSDDSKIVRALKRGRELRVEAISARGTATAYHFSLSGSASAIDKAGAVCS